MTALRIVLLSLLAARALAGPVAMIELPDRVTSIPVHRDAALPAVALVDGGRLVGFVHRVKGQGTPRLVVTDGSGNVRIELGRVMRADGTKLVDAGAVFYDEDMTPRLALEAGMLFRFGTDGPLEEVAKSAPLTLEDAKGRVRATSDAMCTQLFDEKKVERLAICRGDDGVRISGADFTIQGTDSDEQSGTASEYRFVDRKGRSTAIPAVSLKLPLVALPNAGGVPLKKRVVKDRAFVRLSF